MILALLSGCIVPLQVQQQMDSTRATLVAAHEMYAPLCAPSDLALAQSNLDFTRIELHEGELRRAAEHLLLAEQHAAKALEISKPCGGVDQDKDTVPDIVDLCDLEPEDFDGDNDEDGCRDVDPYGDEDGDGVINLEDGCVDQPEDFDGDNDEDGCPETSEDSDGDGIINAVDACVDDAEDLDTFKDTDGCPDLDNDEDGVLDLVDACALIAEDIDEWDDEDGCPDPDNDSDGVPDVNDRCPNTAGDREREGCPLQDLDKDGVADHLDLCVDQPETVNQYLDEDGCPDEAPTGVKVTRRKVEIDETIQFESGSARLLRESHAQLDSVVQVLVDAPYIRLRIEGHTDGEAGDEFNLELSRERALAVRKYIESKGIEASRMESIGYGETRPIDTNRTPSGRARNRRVEFHILREDAQ
jgi:OOP family OmpA-OmpF porin